jgi:hypothetical protein
VIHEEHYFRHRSIEWLWRPRCTCSGPCGSHHLCQTSVYDFSQFNAVVDIGGGQGMLLSTILKNNPNLHGILFDLPRAIETAKKLYVSNATTNSQDHNNNDDVLSRCKLIEGDFFKSIPAVPDADCCYIIKNVILNWDDESAAVILKNCLQAMKKTKATMTMNANQDNNKQKIYPKLLIIDTIMPEGTVCWKIYRYTNACTHS